MATYQRSRSDGLLQLYLSGASSAHAAVSAAFVLISSNERLNKFSFPTKTFLIDIYRSFHQKKVRQKN